jgi:hypothetical protein
MPMLFLIKLFSCTTTYHYQTHGLIELVPEGLRKRLDFSLSLHCVSRMNRRTQIAEIFDLSVTTISDMAKSSKFKGATKTSGWFVPT